MARTLFASKRKSRPALFEALEDRRLMSVTLGVNAITNPGAESNTGSSTGNTVITPTGWTANDTPTVVKYGSTGFPSTTSTGAPSRGANFFAGGPNTSGNAESDLFQTIDLSNLASSVDAGKIKFALSGYLGGLGSKSDNASIFVNWQSSTHGFVNQSFIGPVTAANRGNVTELLLRSLSGTVPATARFAQVQIHFEGSTGYDDAFADNLALTFTSTATTGTVTGTVLNDVNGNGAKDTGEVGLGGVKVYIDANGNGKYDTGETFTTTASNGTYTFSNRPVGAEKIGEVLPSGYRSVGADPVSVTVVGGSSVAANFFDSQTALITGTVYIDANGDEVQDGTEKGIAGVTVYLDFNNNGQLDSFELKTTTDANGNFKFTIPFGTYTVREVISSGKTQTTPTGGFTLTLAKGGVSPVEKFGVK